MKKIPTFKNEAEEREFWENVEDFTEYVDINNPIELDLSNLKPSTETISLRLPLSLLNTIKGKANEIDVPYQSFMKMILANALSPNKSVYRPFNGGADLFNDAPSKKKRKYLRK